MSKDIPAVANSVVCVQMHDFGVDALNCLYLVAMAF